MTSEEILVLRNHLGNLESELYELSEFLDRDDVDALDHQWDRIMSRFSFVAIDVQRLLGAAEREEKLRKENETLCRLYEEYTTIRDLIGSEK